MFGNPSLITRIAIGKGIGFLPVGCFAGEYYFGTQLSAQ